MKGSRRFAGAVVALLGLVFAACNSGNKAGPDATAGGPDAAEVTRCPLTGQDLPDGFDPDRAAVAVKVENSREARPQSGLEHADVVYEEIVEGGITRFMAVYHCGTSKKVGPVRSARFDDADIAAPYTRALAYSGSNDIVDRELRKERIVALDEQVAGDALYRDPPGSTSVHSLFADIDKLRRLARKEDVDPPQPGIFTFGDVPANAKKARLVKVNFHASVTIEYRWKRGQWKRSESGERFMTAAGKQLGVTNLLIQEVRVDRSRTLVDVTGNPSPDILVQGTGRALLFRDGRVLRGRWAIQKRGGPSVFTTVGGEAMVFAPGSVWIELVPSKKGDVKGSFSFK